MGMFGPLLLFLALALLVSLILPWIHHGRLKRLEGEVASLRRQLNALSTAEKPEENAFERLEAETPAPLFSPQPAPEPLPPPPSPRPVFVPQTPRNGEGSVRWRDAINFERQFGALLPVWIGGVALALAGFFLVKYSIEQGLLSPTVRVSLGAAFGLGLLWAGNRVRGQADLANGQRIAQALTGAGIADLYVSSYAATSLYGLLPPTLGFILMAAVTAVAVVLSLRHGAPIALLGLTGGMVTPALIHSDHPQAAPLFTYLYFVTAGLMAAIRREHWWLLSIPTVLGAFIWTAIWLAQGGSSPADAFWLGAFLIAIKFTVVGLSQKQFAGDSANGAPLRQPSAILNYLAMAGASLLMGLVAAQSGFGAMSWSLFGLLAAGSIGLAFFDPRLYGLAPWFSLSVNAAMFLAWEGAPPEYTVTLALFAALYATSGYALQLRSANPLNWALLAVAAGVGYYLLGYFELRQTVLFAGIPLFWGGLALVLALLATLATQRILARTPSEYALKQHLLATWSGAATAFVSIALAVELAHHFLALAFAGQALALSWINTKVEIKALRTIVAALAGAFTYLMAPALINTLGLETFALEGRVLPFDPALARNPLLYLALPALLLGGSSLLLRRRNDDALVKVLECGAVGLFAFAACFLLRHAFHPAGEVLTGRASFIERGVTTNMLIALGLAWLWAGDRWSRRALVWSGLAVCGVAFARIAYLDFVWRNPLWSDEYVGAAPVANALLLAYGLPALWLWELARRLPGAGAGRWGKPILSAALALAFTLVTLNVRQLFHGAYLNDDSLGNMEVYAYSVAWLAFGATLLFFGALRGDRLLRVASLLVILFAVGKVFLYDARELEGLYRVFSFLGLGVCLIGLSWFYPRFVFQASGGGTPDN